MNLWYYACRNFFDGGLITDVMQMYTQSVRGLVMQIKDELAQSSKETDSLHLNRPITDVTG